MLNEPKKRITLPRYQQIAVDIAERITENRYSVGEKLHARSTLASTYGVSPETTRKAINVLVDLGIMEVKHGSGVYVASKERAKDFALQYRDVQSVQELKNEIMASVERQKDELNNFSAILDTLVTQTKRLNSINPFVPFELLITNEAKHLEATISELGFWQHTAATLIAIRHQNELLLSPGPYAKISENDTIYFVGNELALQRVEAFFYN
ncbi:MULTISPECIES: GntR family transcriptional regulator [unclassified Enterococcus]|uniref:GntR family transcriptional regulator n=1 Tax=unclassified Enterococcus TaxID=2608891 RepID=UPI001556892E|nr:MULTISPECIES: GntR family transcriptional regulator [unclassified Enterococcus]MBS7576349.1 GntR family transcriptional regulator [Enterococcus sp. MMGLQ5-2]MBS7583581.1 GntR family transcriptional regulator [Enterococcus sp. MMGLQ5-1]NPD11443.1 GntR family transcriptional regulator [Enterococcus sp. MMGLQ5-1]NPD36187.1 GntR family transcriptional regulator [Enterococcus sp. MMGLQ5-2]